jgi:hypothetical protein
MKQDETRLVNTKTGYYSLLLLSSCIFILEKIEKSTIVNILKKTLYSEYYLKLLSSVELFYLSTIGGFTVTYVSNKEFSLEKKEENDFY